MAQERQKNWLSFLPSETGATLFSAGLSEAACWFVMVSVMGGPPYSSSSSGS